MLALCAAHVKEEVIVVKQNAGIDVSKDTFDVAFSYLTADFKTVVVSTRKFSSTAKGFQQLQDWVKGKQQHESAVHFTMEATGVYYEGLAYFLHEKGHLVHVCCAKCKHVVLPNKAHRYAQSLGLKSKTDKIDSRTLAQMLALCAAHVGLERELRLWLPVSPSLLALKQLTRERDALVRCKTDVANQLHAYRHQAKPNKATIVRSKKTISFLEGQITQIDKDIKTFACTVPSTRVNKDKELKTKMDFLLSIPGIGLVSATTIVAETNGFATFESIKQLTSYAGLDVKISESGTWKGKSKISKQGNSHIRKVLYMPALSKIVHDKKTKLFYERLKEKKGVGMIAVVAIMRKLLGLMYTLWKKEEIYKDETQ